MGGVDKGGVDKEIKCRLGVDVSRGGRWRDYRSRQGVG